MKEGDNRTLRPRMMISTWSVSRLPWTDEEAVAGWRLRVAAVVRDYGMSERRQPVDGRATMTCRTDASP
jgi:hypothetical protein